MKTVSRGDCVSVIYEGKLDSGEVFDANDREHPLRFEVGTGDLIAGFEDAVIGMKAGESRQITIGAEKAYGAHDPERVLHVARAHFDGDDGPTPEAGMAVTVDMGGRRAEAHIVAVDEKTVTLDLNHPLAGKTLHFDIEVAEVRAAGDPGNIDWINESRRSCCSCDDCHDHDGCCESDDNDATDDEVDDEDGDGETLDLGDDETGGEDLPQR